MKKKLFIASVVAASGLGLVGTSAMAASAQSTDSIVDKIATRFNVSRDEVQAVFDEERAARQAERQAEYSERLQEKVDSGDITAEQKTLIEDKMKELEASREAKQDELKAWAEENGIDAKYIMIGRGHSDKASDRLQDAVDDGDITAEKKTLIETKIEELRAEREAQRDELEQWAEDNNLDLQDIMPLGGGHGRGMGPR